MATLQEEIAAKANITVDQAKLAYDHVLDTIKSKIPPSLGDEIHKVMDGHEFNLDSSKTIWPKKFSVYNSALYASLNFFDAVFYFWTENILK